MRMHPLSPEVPGNFSKAARILLSFQFKCRKSKLTLFFSWPVWLGFDIYVPHTQKKERLTVVIITAIEPRGHEKIILNSAEHECFNSRSKMLKCQQLLTF